MNEIYMGQIRPVTFNGVQRFHMVWTLAGGGPGNHQHDAYHKGLYYCSFQPSNRHFYSVTGTDLGTSIDNTDMENSCKVLDTTLVRKLPLSRDIGYIHTVDLLADGTPYLVYVRQNGETATITSARRSGSSWVHTAGVSGGRFADMDGLRVYVANEQAPGIKVYLATPGQPFILEQEISTSQAIQHIETIPGSPDPVRAIATGFSTSDDPTVATGNIYAIGAPACTASSVAAVSASSDDGNVPPNTLDNNLATRWSASGDGQWIQFDLGSVKQVCSASIAFYKGNERRSIFALEGSTDGLSWSPLWSGQSSGTSLAQELFSFTRTDARYVRYLGHGNTLSAWNSLTEVDIAVA